MLLVKYRNFQIFTLSDFPASCFVINESEPDRMLTADLSFREFPGLMKGVVEYDKKSYVEGTGVKYRLGDFQVSFMTIYMGQSAVIKGLLIEVSFGNFVIYFIFLFHKNAKSHQYIWCSYF